MNKTLASRAHVCHEDFLAMSVSMAKVAASLRPRFDIHVMLESGHTVPATASQAYNRKFAEYLERSKARWLKEQAQLGKRHADYETFLKSVPLAKRPDLENRTTIRAWSAASGPFLEALCLLADIGKTTNARTVHLLGMLQLFVPWGPIEVFAAGKRQFIGVQPTIVARRSRLNACRDILITGQPTTRHANIVGIRDCKCHRRLPSDELRKECGKASDLMVDAYVIVTYHTQSAKLLKGAAALGINIENLGLDTSAREEYIRGEKNLVIDLGRKLSAADEERRFRRTMESDGEAARSRRATDE
jgi:hypothetical protein